MTKFLDGAAEAWILARVDEYVAQISSTVTKDVNNNGYPKVADWKAAIVSTKTQVREVIAMGAKLANAGCRTSLALICKCASRRSRGSYLHTCNYVQPPSLFYGSPLLCGRFSAFLIPILSLMHH